MSCYVTLTGPAQVNILDPNRTGTRMHLLQPSKEKCLLQCLPISFMSIFSVQGLSYSLKLIINKAGKVAISTSQWIFRAREQITWNTSEPLLTL